MEELYMSYIDRKNTIKETGLGYIEEWEHSFDRRMSSNDQFKRFINTLPYTDPLTPSEAFSGGRTELFCLYMEATKDNKISFLDVNSLYPFCQYNTYPIKHPKIIFGNQIKENDIDEYFGLMKLTILPPTDLFIPVLGMHMNGKFTFGLCNACMLSKQTHKCKHSIKQRALLGVWVSEEIKLALQYGYKILTVYEVWHWSAEKRSSDLFKEYLQCYLKYKVESSGFPAKYDTLEGKQQYVNMWEAKFGVKVQVCDVITNPAKRTWSKSQVTNLWGKMSQRTRGKTAYLDTPAEYFDLLLSDKDTVTSVQFVNKNMLEVHYETDTDFQKPHSFGNVVIAAFVTAYGRIELYNHIKHLGNRLLYVDTDSLVFIGDGPPIGNGLLGELGDEIYSSHKVKDSIQTWCGTRAKSYAYSLVLNPHIEVCKVKGITLNYDTSKKINLKAIKEILHNPRHDDVTVTTKNCIRRDMQTKKIRSETITKTFRVTCDKRVRKGELFITLPYGHKDVPEKAS
jgi:hypothetical protein